MVAPLRYGALPLSFDDLTPQWLSEALSGHFPGVEVTDVVRTGERFGTSSSARLDLTYGDRGGSDELPRAVYVKGGFNELTRKRMWGALQQEARFYSELA